MAENIELIAAKDLPITEAEEVSVVCLENGELKQKPCASFGGGGGGYITVVDFINMEDGYGAINESYDNFIGTLLAGGTVWINMASAMGENFYVMAVGWGFQEEMFVLMGNLGGSSMMFVCPNGTWTPEG